MKDSLVDIYVCSIIVVWLIVICIGLIYAEHPHYKLQQLEQLCLLHQESVREMIHRPERTDEQERAITKESEFILRYCIN